MAHFERPRMRIVSTSLDWILSGVSLAGVLFAVAVVAVAWPHLPARVPTHFGISGQPDAWGSPSSLLLLVILPIITYAGLSILARVPWTFNYPVTLTEQNYERAYRLGRSAILWLRTEVVWLCAVMAWQTIRVATQAASGLAPWLVLVPVGVIGCTGIYFLVLLTTLRDARHT